MQNVYTCNTLVLLYMQRLKCKKINSNITLLRYRIYSDEGIAQGQYESENDKILNNQNCLSTLLRRKTKLLPFSGVSFHKKILVLNN